MQHQLSYDAEMDRWVLWLRMQGVQAACPIDASYCMVIRCAWNGESWFSYRFLKWEHGDYVELYTEEEYTQRVQDIEEHEGSEVAALWVSEQNQVKVALEDHPIFALRKYWEAMMELKLFFPSVNHREWKGKELPHELRERMDAIRTRQIEETVEEMKAEAGAVPIPSDM